MDKDFVQPPFVPAGPMAGSMHIRTTVQPPSAGSAPSTLIYRENKTTITRRLAATKAAVIDAQLKDGAIEVNIAALARDDVLEFVHKLRECRDHVQVLRFKSVPRRMPNSAYAKHDMNESYIPVPDRKGKTAIQKQDDADEEGRGKPPPYMSEKHKHGVRIASAHLQHKTIRYRLYDTLQFILTRSHITEMEIGMRLSRSGYVALSTGLAQCKTIKRLSFAGSHMGDMPLAVLQDGLAGNTSLEEVDMTACDIGDEGVTSLAAVIKSHAKRRSDMIFKSGLRQYPDMSTRQETAHMQHYLTMKQLVREADQECGGWLLLELALNPRITDFGALNLRTALSFDRRLVMLSLRATGLSFSSEGEFVSLMREHQALARVDLRQCTGFRAKSMGILKLQKTSAPTRLTAIGLTKPKDKECPSPTLTHKSIAFWELMEGDASLGGGQMLGLGVGDLGASPWASPTASTAPKRQASLSSHMSWGDAQLLQHLMRSPSFGHHASQQDVLRRSMSHQSSYSQSMPPSPTRVSFIAGMSKLGSEQKGSGGGSREMRSTTNSNTDSGGGTPDSPQRQGAAAGQHGEAQAGLRGPMGTMHAAVGQVPALFREHATQTKTKRRCRLKQKKKRKPPSSLSVGAGISAPEQCSGYDGGVWERSGDGIGAAPGSKANADEAMAEVVGLLRQLEIEVSAAEYQAQLSREHHSTWGQPPIQPPLPTFTFPAVQPSHNQLHQSPHGNIPSELLTQHSPLGTYTQGDRGKGNCLEGMLRDLAPAMQALGMQIPHLHGGGMQVPHLHGGGYLGVGTDAGHEGGAGTSHQPSMGGGRDMGGGPAGQQQQARQALQAQLFRWCEMCDEVLEDVDCDDDDGV